VVVRCTGQRFVVIRLRDELVNYRRLNEVNWLCEIAVA